MKTKVINAANFSPSRSSKFFLDSNVWMYLNFPQHSDVAKQIIDSYSDFFDKIISKGCLIETNIVQISELVNLILHLEFVEAKKLNKFQGNFKSFRASDLAGKALLHAKTLSDQIVKCSTLRDGVFGVDELKEIVAECDKADFNDLFFAKFCIKEDAILVTHDFDFKAIDTDIKVVSFNRKYFN